MTADLSELHDDLRAVAAGLLAGSPGWRQIADAGWLGLEAPAGLGGAGAGFAEVAVVLREMGRAAAPGPYLSVAVLAAGALGLAAPAPHRDDLLRATVSGEAVPVLALPAETPGIPFRIDGTRLSGTAAFVPDAPVADHLLVPALDPGGVPRVVVLDPRTPGLTITEQPVVDATRTFGQIVADDVRPGPELRLGGGALQRLHDRAAVAIACDSLGLSEAMLDATVAYAGIREQFGRKIGSFQAVKHACADMLVRISVARKLVDVAVRAQAHDEADGPATASVTAPVTASVAASMAKSYACAAAVEIAGKAMQLHGGLGYTWESGVHVHLKRAALNRALYGTPAHHRRRLSARYRRE
ncbi:acyl-CoA dehydrogenase family protein [Spirillospora sp. NPDC047279]|uniref:acyl-CoA dehydrogenase family protein n=1 Tax=Spirillospora sp. NPDC047279 TaxID=3155478 RepID=UPI0033E4DFEB